MQQIKFYTKNINGTDVRFVKMWDRYGYEFEKGSKVINQYVYAPNTEKDILKELAEEVIKLI